MQIVRKIRGVFKGNVSKAPKPVHGSDVVIFDSTAFGTYDPLQQRAHHTTLAKAAKDQEDALLQQSRNWSQSYADLERDPEWKAKSKRSWKHSETYLALIEERKGIMADVDALLVRMSTIAGVAKACESADGLRACLAKSPDEEKHFFELWRMRMPQKPYDRVVVLAHIRLAMQDAKIISLICKDDPQLAVVEHQALKCVERLPSCPAVRIHVSVIDDVDEAIFYEMAALSEGDALAFYTLVRLKEPTTTNEDYLLITAQHDLLRCVVVQEISERLGLEKAALEAMQNAIGIHLRHLQTDDGKAMREAKGLLMKQTQTFERTTFFHHDRAYLFFFHFSHVE